MRERHTEKERERKKESERDREKERKNDLKRERERVCVSLSCGRFELGGERLEINAFRGYNG